MTAGLTEVIGVGLIAVVGWLLTFIIKTNGRLVALETWERKQNGSLQSLEKKVDKGFEKLDTKLERLLHNPR